MSGLVDTRSIEVVSRETYASLKETAIGRIPRDRRDWPTVALAMVLDTAAGPCDRWVACARSRRRRGIARERTRAPRSRRRDRRRGSCHAAACQARAAHPARCARPLHRSVDRPPASTPGALHPRDRCRAHRDRPAARRLILEVVVGQHRAAELASELVEGNEGAGAIDGHQLGDRMAVDGDAQSLACFDAAQQARGVVP